MTNKILIIISIFTFWQSTSQKKQLTHKDYDLWKEITDIKVSVNGKLIVSEIKRVTRRGDGYLEIYNSDTQKKYQFENGYAASITCDEKYIIFRQKPEYETLRKEIKKKTKKEDQSKDKLLIFNVKLNKIVDTIQSVKGYKVPEKTPVYIVIEHFKNRNRTSKREKQNTVKGEYRTSFIQDYILIYNLKNKRKDTVLQIKDYVLPEFGDIFYYSTTTGKNQKKNNKRDIGVYSYNIRTGVSKVIDTGKYKYDKLSTNQWGDHFAYLSARDSTSLDSLRFELQVYVKDTLKTLVDVFGNNLQDGWMISKNQKPKFSKNSKRLYFYSKPIPTYYKDTTLLENEIPEVDIWNWKDKMIQPEQGSNYKELSEKAYCSYYDIQKEVFVRIQDENIDALYMNQFKEQKYILGSDKSPYQREYSWKHPRTQDFYVVNTETGKKRVAVQNIKTRPFLSPDNKFAVYFDNNQQHWFSLELSTLKLRNLTGKLDVIFYDKENDRPSSPLPHGFGGFDQDGNALIYDQFDIWRVFLDGSKRPQNITRIGVSKKIVFRTERLDPEQKAKATYVNKKLLVTSFDKKTKVSGLYLLNKQQLIEKIKPTSFLIKNYTKASKTDILAFTKENFNTSPNLYFSNKEFKNILRINDINPQQEEFKWGIAELFYWKAYDGKKLEGIIYKPEDFDPSKKYPMITHFYEKKSDTYSKYHIPKPSKSTVNRSYLVSNDYVLFVPNIIYDEGKPGASAYNCIVSGVEAVEKLGYVDSNNIGIQGQSWGGYQVAYLITVTNKFKAAMAGAPVSNMTSAYGGIRWESGRSRAFQYEKGQSRIGKSLWERPDFYIKNSPLFGIPNIETPLLIMHNDQDGAVPYYQGIEMFMGMRRLEKPVWLLVYNKEAHNLKKMKNKQDLSIRMMQFFDHYLKNKPAPMWMTNGVSRVNKGIDLGYELDIKNKS
ncbi:prolyl oligopeptidase family serine peptidase [uncultured Aquimarina sp.]|uniref:alpha/beta hydrolase family protein n=1 Tax=uncultured Aquimarina sp. TaxID=575652 RepID=UPI002610B34E|nr:prolyl oligopeptidase family serine peptidase [uncultured Aquimarina sp.]